MSSNVDALTRLKVVAYAQQHGDSAAAREFGFNRGTIYRWRQAREAEVAPPPEAVPLPDLEDLDDTDRAPDLPEMAALSLKQRRFVLAYLGRAGGNATEAAKLAGYGPGGNRETLRQIGARTLRSPKVRTALDALMAAEALSDKEILWRMGAQARGDLAQYITLEGGVPTFDLEAIKADGLGHLLKEVRINADGTLVIKLHDGQAALDKLARASGLYKDRVEHSGPGGGPIETKATLDPRKLPLDVLRALLAALAADDSEGG